MENYEPLSPHPETNVDNSEERFADCLKRIRTRLKSKQVWLSEAIGCSDAAVSLWETGSRIPTPASLSRILAVLASEGTSDAELLALRRVWIKEAAQRRFLRRS